MMLRTFGWPVISLATPVSLAIRISFAVSSGTKAYGYLSRVAGLRRALYSPGNQPKPGKEREFEQLLNNPAAGRAVAQALGATRHILFLKNGRMIRVLEVPEGVKPLTMGALAERDPNVKAFLRKIGPLIQDGFAAEDPASLIACEERIPFPLAYDVKV